jgi:CRP-like cAMP-binding protein
MVERILVSLLEQLEQTTQVAQENLDRQSVANLNMRFLEDGEVVIREGERGGEVYKLVSAEGGLRVTQGGRQLGMITQADEIFGEMSGILDQRRPATITSVGRSVVQVYPREQLEELIEENPSFARQLIEHLAARLAKANELAGGECT